MKKQIIATVMAAVIGMGAAACMVGCGDDADTSLQYGVKYINRYSVTDSAETQEYFVFSANGTGEYHDYRFFSASGIITYTVNFKYVFCDKDKSAVVCFYDSVEYDDNAIGNEVKSTWTYELAVSKNVVIGSGTYINENYLSQIPNFGK